MRLNKGIGNETLFLWMLKNMQQQTASQHDRSIRKTNRNNCTIIPHELII